MTASALPNPTLAEQYLRKCRHFTGVHTGRCLAGVPYRDVTDTSVSPYRFACFSDGAYLSCAMRLMRTAEEAEAEATAMQSYAQEMFRKLKDEGICPHCQRSVHPLRQVGRCVYGACGCRLYHGHFATGGGVGMSFPTIQRLDILPGLKSGDSRDFTQRGSRSWSTTSL